MDHAELVGYGHCLSDESSAKLANLEVHGRDGLAAGEGGADGSGGGGVEHAGEGHPLVHAQRVPHEHHRLPAPRP